MCQGGFNSNQTSLIIEHLSSQIALDRRLVHKLYHAADDAELFKSAHKLKDVQNLLDEARSLLEEAGETILNEAAASKDITVELV